MPSKNDKLENPGCLGILYRILGIGPKEGDDGLPFRLRDDFLSPAELSFLKVLEQMKGARLTVLTKVNLADLFYVIRPQENMPQMNKINRKHVDFLMCDAKTMKPILGIELYDRSHQQKKRKERDAFVDQVFRMAGLPLAHVPAAMSYSTTQLNQIFREAMQKRPTKQAIAEKDDGSYPVNAAAAEPPLCPKCGVPMVLREAKKGPHKGEKFYGCVNYPRWKEMIPRSAVRSIEDKVMAGKRSFRGRIIDGS